MSPPFWAAWPTTGPTRHGLLEAPAVSARARPDVVRALDPIVMPRLVAPYGRRIAGSMDRVRRVVHAAACPARVAGSIPPPACTLGRVGCGDDCGRSASRACLGPLGVSGGFEAPTAALGP